MTLIPLPFLLLLPNLALHKALHSAEVSQEPGAVSEGLSSTMYWLHVEVHGGLVMGLKLLRERFVIL